MKHTLMLVLITIVTSTEVQAQAITRVPTNSLNSVTNTQQFALSEVNGRPFKRMYGELAGAAYLTDGYRLGTVIMRKGQKIEQIKIRLDLVTQEVSFIDANGAEAYLDAGLVSEISFYDTTAKGIVFYRLKTGYPVIDHHASFHFYQVLAEGNIILLRWQQKVIAEKKNYASGETVRELNSEEAFYIVGKNGMRRVKKEREWMTEILSDKKIQVEQYLKENKVNFRNPEQLTQLIAYYNTL